jgi:uncharacterized protein YjbI with pentapeptide repeats
MTTAKSEPDPDALHKLQIARINELTSVGRTNWFGLLAYLAFTTVTVLSVQDADFFIPGRDTSLPLIGVSIPTYSFFIYAPLLGAALYVYLHLHIRKLVWALADAPETYQGSPLEDHLKTWLLNDLVLMLRKDRAYRRRAMDWLSMVTTLTLIWLAGPVILLLTWARSWPAHDEWLTSAIFLYAALTIYAGLISWISLQRALGHPAKDPLVRRVAWTAATAITLIALFFGLIKTEIGETFNRRLAGNEQPGIWTSIAPIDMSGLTISTLPADRLNPVRARRADRAAWCETQDMPANLCQSNLEPWDSVPDHLRSSRAEWCLSERGTTDIAQCQNIFLEQNNTFRAVWASFRREEIAGLQAIDLSGSDLRNADFSSAYLIGVRLVAAQMEGADLEGAQMQGADLRRAQMQGANLGEAQMQGANLREAQMQGASLEEAQMQGANLERAQLQRAWLRGTNLQRANLSFADLDWAILSGVQMQDARFVVANMNFIRISGSSAEFADFSGAQLISATIFSSRFQGADIYSANLQGVAMSQINLTEVPLSDRQVETMFGDASVFVPPAILRPQHWPEDRLPYDQIDPENSAFHIEWRRWQADPQGYMPPPPGTYSGD